MLKKTAYAILAGSLVIGAPFASADDTQFDIGGGRYQGVAALPFGVVPPSNTMAAGELVTPSAPRRLESTRADVTTGWEISAPAPYNVPGGYFN